MQKPETGEYYFIEMDGCIVAIIKISDIDPINDNIIYYKEVIEDSKRYYYNTSRVCYWKEYQHRKLTPVEIVLFC